MAHHRRAIPVLLSLAAALAVGLSGCSSSSSGSAWPSSSATPGQSGQSSATPQQTAQLTAAGRLPTRAHVFVINIENKGFDRTWGGSEAPYLARTLRPKGTLLARYYGTAHHSQGNYVGQISGQGPSTKMQHDCSTYAPFRSTGTAAPGQVRGDGCVFGTGVRSLPQQLTASHRSWKGYMESMPRACAHPALGASDPWFHATRSNEYATRHNPFVYFRWITSRPSYCAAHVVGLPRLATDLRSITTTPALSYITPNLCNDGHDTPCANGQPGGLRSVDSWMRTWVPKILNSPAFKRDGILVITADESDSPSSDSSGCCGEASVNVSQAGIDGPGGGLIGALVISRWTRAGATSQTAYNHYSLLATMEDLWHLPRLGYAARATRFGTEVFAG